MAVEAPVAKRAWADARARWGGAVTFLGIIGDLAHQGSRSGHNAGNMAEAHNYSYGAYDGVSALAVDIGVGTNVTLGNQIRDYMLGDPRVLYVIYRGVGYRPYWRGGGTWNASGHMTHVHTSFTARSTNDTRPFFGGAPAATTVPTLNIGGMKVARLTRVELANWIRKSREYTRRLIIDQDSRQKAAFGVVIAKLDRIEQRLKAIEEDIEANG